MELSQNNIDDVNLINEITSSAIYINKQSFHKSCIISNHTIIADLDFDCIDKLSKQNIEQLLLSKPDIIIFGSGKTHQFPNIELLTPIANQDIGFEVMNNKSAARTYNILVAEMRKVACLLILD